MLEEKDERQIAKQLTQFHPGGQAPLSQEEKADMDAFLSRSRAKKGHAKGDIATPAAPAGDGYIPVTVTGARAMYYPEDWTLHVRPADVKLVKGWSAIDEQSLLGKNEYYNDVMRRSVRITSASGDVSWEELCPWDRMWLMATVRDYTFLQPEKQIVQTEKCPACGRDVDVQFMGGTIIITGPDTAELPMECFDRGGRKWRVNPGDWGVEGPVLELSCPTLRGDAAVVRWVMARAEDDIPPVFIKQLPWLLGNLPEDQEDEKAYIDRVYEDWDAWSPELFEFAQEVIDMVSPQPQTYMEDVCPDCGGAVRSELNFPSGMRCLFAPAGQRRKFGKK